MHDRPSGPVTANVSSPPSVRTIRHSILCYMSLAGCNLKTLACPTPSIFAISIRVFPTALWISASGL